MNQSRILAASLLVLAAASCRPPATAADVSQPANGAAPAPAAPVANPHAQPANPHAQAANPHAQGGAPTGAQPGGQPAGAEIIGGTVAETLMAGPYVYLKLTQGTQEMWAAVPGGPEVPTVGAQARVRVSTVMENFNSPTLKRTFPVLAMGTVVPADR